MSAPAVSQGRNVVVIGTQWGDEGKGKIVDWLTDHAQGVVRFQDMALGVCKPRRHWRHLDASGRLF